MPLTTEQRKKISDTLKRKGIRPPSRLGIPSSDFQKQRASETHKGNKWRLGKSWQKEVVGYVAHHMRVKNKFGKAKFCSNFLGCKSDSKMYHWANIRGNYNDINDYISLCQSCHQLYDYGKIAIRIWK